jgi:hypothetical protein
MAKQITVQCPQEIADIMIESLNWFVARHYPSGADECSIAARDALFGLVHHFEEALREQGCCTYSIRMRAFLCEAVRAYLQQLAAQRGECFSHRSRVVIDVCRGDSDGAEFAAAAGLDAALPGPLL